jgi:tetratricopeptide (TPR) repeat protein
MNESVQKWLAELTAAPATAIQKLVLGYAGVTAWSRSSLRESFAEIFQTHAEPLDAAVATWLQEHLMKLPPEKTPTLVWASHLQDLFSAIAGLPLPQVARLLRDRLRDFRSWLRPLRTDDGLDPEAAYLSALAWSETNQHLEGMWHGLALRLNHEPVYYTDIGLLGLRKPRDDAGQLPAKAPFLLLATLIDLADNFPEKDWLLTTSAMLGGYPCSLETWVREFEPVLESRPNAKNGPKWLKKILPQMRIRQQSDQTHPRDMPAAHSQQEKELMIAAVAKNGPEAIGEKLETFLKGERNYATITGDPRYLVPTFNRLAKGACKHDPDWAVARVNEALLWEENNPRNRVVLAQCLWTSGRQKITYNTHAGEKDCREAIDTLWIARFDFPMNSVVRNELARLHRDAGDLVTAEAIYREAILEFPNEPHCRDGLATILKNQNKIVEAEQINRESLALFPNDFFCRHSLAVILFYRSAETGNVVEKEESRQLFLEAAKLGNHKSRTWFAGFEAGWQRQAKSQQGFDETTNVEREADESIALHLPTLDEMSPAQRLGRALLLQWQARHAESAGERERFFAEAETLLALPDELTGECKDLFLEARGFLLLARDRTAEARTYFEQQLAATAPHRPLGLRLGFAEARARLGETLSDKEETELSSFGPEGSILPLVLKVVRLLESTTSDNTLRDLLLGLYPRVLDLAGMPASELGEEYEPANLATRTHQPKPADAQMAQILLASVFRPANINTAADFQVADAIPRIRASLKSHRDDIFPVAFLGAEKLPLAA